MPSRALSLADLTTARRLYEVDGQSYRDLGQRFGVSHSTIRVLLTATGCASRAVGWPQRPRQPAPPPAPPRPTIVFASTLDRAGRLRIPLRTAAERRRRWFTPPELEAIAQALRASVVLRHRPGRSGLPERHGRARGGATYAFVLAMQKVKRAA